LAGNQSSILTQVALMQFSWCTHQDKVDVVPKARVATDVREYAQHFQSKISLLNQSMEKDIEYLVRRTFVVWMSTFKIADTFVSVCLERENFENGICEDGKLSVPLGFFHGL